MAPRQTLKLTNGPNTDDLKIKLEVDGVIEENGKGTITKNVADETVEIPFRGTITTFDDERGAGSASIDGESVRFADLEGWDTREHAGSDTDAIQDAPATADDSSHDPDGEAVLSSPGKGVAIGAGAWIPSGEYAPRRGLVDRCQKTAQDRTIHVDPDESGGVQNALNRLPREIEHDIDIVLGAGVHRGNGSACRTGRIYVHSTGELTIRGEGHETTRVTSGINASLGASKQSHMEVRKIHWDGLSQFAGRVYLRDCRFSGFDSAGVNATSTSAISGKNGSVWAKNCLIGDPEDDYAIHSTIQERYTLINCELRASEAAVKLQDGCSLDVGWGCGMDAPRFSSAERKLRRGRYVGGRYLG